MSSKNLSDSQHEQIDELMPEGGNQILIAIAEEDEGEGVTIPDLAGRLGWAEDEVEDVLDKMRNRGLLGPPPLGERVYIGGTDYTLADFADERGWTVEEALDAFAGLEEWGLVGTIQISDYEHVIVMTEEGVDEMRALKKRFGGELPERYPTET